MKGVYKNIVILLSITVVIVLTDIRAYPASYFYINRPALGIDLEFEYEEEVREGPFISRVNQTTDMTEKLDIQTTGWIYHPALASYSLKFSPEWNQVKRQTSSTLASETDRTNSFFKGFETEIVLLSYKPYTLTLFAKKDNNSLRNNFSGRTIREETSYGSLLALKYNILPTTINYTHSESQTSGFFTESRKIDQLRLISSNSSQLGFIRLSGLYSKSDNRTIDTAVVNEQKGYNISHSRSFLEKNKVTLRSSLSYNDTIIGDSTSREVVADENLSWRHSNNLSTWYNFKYRDRNFFDARKAEEADIKTVSGNFNLNHRLYENLNTNLTAGAIRIRNTGNEESKYNAGVNFHYQREVPVGAVQVNMGQHISVTEVNFSSDFSHVIDESVSLVNTFTFLELDNIDITSITVRDNMGTIYPEVGNYVLSSTGNLTRIRCIAGGQLDAKLGCSAGAPVLISYDYRIKVPFDYLTYNQLYGVNLSFKDSVNMYYSFRGSEQYFLRGIRSSTEELLRDESHVIGMTLRGKWSETNMTYENRESTTFQLKKANISEVITLQPNYNSVIRISLGYSKSQFTNETENAGYFTMSYENVISGRAKFSAKSFYNKISSQSYRIVDKGLRVAFDWVYRIYRGGITYSYSQLEDQIVQDVKKNNYILFSVSRELF